MPRKRPKKPPLPPSSQQEDTAPQHEVGAGAQQDGETGAGAQHGAAAGGGAFGPGPGGGATWLVGCQPAFAAVVSSRKTTFTEVFLRSLRDIGRRRQSTKGKGQRTKEPGDGLSLLCPSDFVLHP